MTNKRKVKRRLRGTFVALVAAVVLVVLCIIKIPRFINENKLLELGYSKESIASIYKRGLKSTILKNSYYSDYLNSEIVKEDFNSKYLRLYLLCDDLNEDYFEMYELLKAKRNYSDEELEELFKDLKLDGLSPLLVFEKLENISDYIEDYNAHPENNKNIISLYGDYLKPYENYKEISDVSAIDVFVSSKTYLGEYVPEKLAPVSSLNAIPGVLLESRALDAFNELCTALREEDLSMAIYAIGGYISYDSQKDLAISGNQYIKAGFSDTQTGLGVYIVASENESSSRIRDTKAYAWLMDNAHKFGFIQRFPEGKEALTGHSATYNYFRYVGKDLASAIHDSGLCFDEYYYRFID